MLKLVKLLVRNSKSVGAQLLSNLIINKVLALYVGPAGYVIYSQLQNTFAILLSFANGSIGTGVVSELSKVSDKDKYKDIIGTCNVIVIMMSLICSIWVLFNQSYLIEKVFNFESGYYLIVFLLFSLPAAAYHSLICSVLNGRQCHTQYINIGFTNSIINLLVTLLLTTYFLIEGAIWGYLIFQFTSSLVALYFLNKAKVGRVFYYKFNKIVASKLFKFSVMTFVSISCIPISLLLIRTELLGLFPEMQVGLWDASVKVSSLVLLLITSTLGIYFSPKVAKVNSETEALIEIKNVLLLIMPLFTLVLITLYFFSYHLIKLLFTESFLGMSSILLWQTAGEMFKLFAWLFITYYTMKGDLLTHVLLNILFYFIYLLVVYNFEFYQDITSVAVIYFFVSVLYFMFAMFIFNLRKNR